MERIQKLFYVLILRKYIRDPSHVLVEPPVEVANDLSYPIQLVHIVDQLVRYLRSRSVLMVRVLWQNGQTEEHSWETEESMRARFSHLF